MNMSMLLRDRELHPFQMRLSIENALEDSFVAGNACKFDNPLPPSVSSTIAIAMSCDGQTFATTHGDHTVKVFDFISGEQIRVFSGHPRTPWTIKYHPTDPNIIASGCLGYEVRVWHIERNVCLNLNTYSQTIISLAFHPTGYFIAVACGMSIQLWDWQNSTGEIEGTFPIIPAKPNTTGMAPQANHSASEIAEKDPSVVQENEEGADQVEPENPINWRGITHTRNIRAVLFHPSGDYIFAVAPDSPKQTVEELAHCRLYACEFSALLNVDSVPVWGSPTTYTTSSTSSSKNDATPANAEITRSYEEDQLEDLVALDDPIFPLKLSSCRVLIPQIHLYSDGGIDVSKDGRYLITCARVSVPPTMANDLFSQRSSSLLSPSTPNHPPPSVYNANTARSAQGRGMLPPLFDAPLRGTERPYNVPPTSSLPPPPPPPASSTTAQGATSPGVLSFASLRSTMNALSQRTGLSGTSAPSGPSGLSSGGSSHSDFRTVPSSSTSGQPSAQASPVPPAVSTVATTSAPVTPGAHTVTGAFTPPPPPVQGPSPVTHTFISPLTNTNTNTNTQLSNNPSHTPLQLSAPAHTTPNGENNLLGGLMHQMSLSPNRQRDPDGAPRVIDMITKRTALSTNNSADTTPYKAMQDGATNHTPELSHTGLARTATSSAEYNALYHSYGGYLREAHTRRIHQCTMHKLMSRAGQMRGWKTEDHLCVFELNFTSTGIISKPTLLNSKHMPGGLMKAVTSAKLSGTCRYALIGYGVRVGGQVPDHARRHAACEVVSVHAEHMPSVTVMSDFEDEVNIAQFHPMPGHGIVYGTKRGKIRTFSKA